MKIAVQNGGEPFYIAFWQALFCAMILYIYIVIKHGKLGLKLSYMQFLILLGIFGSALPNVIFYVSAERLNAGFLAISVSFIPLLTYTFAFVFKIEAFSFKRVLGVVLGAVALNLILLPESSMPRRGDVLWMLIVCIAAVSYAIENLIIDIKMPDDIGAVRVACGMNFMGAALVLPVAMLSNQLMIPEFPPSSLEVSVLGLGVINALAYSIFIFLVRRTGPVFASQTGYVVTIGGMLWGILLFSESYSTWVWASLFVLILGIILVSPRSQGNITVEKK